MRRLTISVVLALAMLASACGGDSDSDDSGDSSAGQISTTTAADSGTDAGEDNTTTTTEDSGGGGLDDIADVRNSVVQIQAQGTFEFFEGTMRNAQSTGSGFVISEDGIVVTNNHVVTGAATLAVKFPDGDDPINAQILGVSECSDLAVIQLVGDGYAPLTFRDDEVRAGLPVYSAGFPASDDNDFDNLDFTLTAGIVSSTEAKGETNWASVDGVLQHDARILGGNSGGPLVDEQGRVVGINYAGSDQFDTNFAIDADTARPIIEQLAAGNDVDSLGINGEAVVFDSGFTGIWIRSVKSGSPADQAGIEPGDLLLELENLIMAADGTMADYCDVLRTQGADATMDVSVYRPSLDLVLEGQINGLPIIVPLITETVIEETGGQPTSGGDNGDALGVSYTYTTATDDSGRISVSVPDTWQVNGEENPNFGPSVWASPDLQGFLDFWDVPGIIVESAPNRPASDIPVLLQERSGLNEFCEDLGQQDYDDGFYAGVLQIYGNCGGIGTYYVVLAATPLDGDYLVRVEIQATEPRDLEAGDEALRTFVANA
ncbi:MAG: S1C family serine protease [Acidimicrobiales bacterium]